MLLHPHPLISGNRGGGGGVGAKMAAVEVHLVLLATSKLFLEVYCIRDGLFVAIVLNQKERIKTNQEFIKIQEKTV